MARRSGYVTVDVGEFVDAIPDEELLEEVARRKIAATPTGEPLDLELVEEAYGALLAGRAADARVILDRLLHPKWKSREQCREQFDGLKLPVQH